MVEGCDLWLNNPRRPLEASGTSGMKVIANGGLNFSILDGWWDEGYDGKNGWAIKPVSEFLPEAQRNREESQTLYELLQDQVIPTYYRHNKMGYSSEWVKMSKRSIATLLPLGKYPFRASIPRVWWVSMLPKLTCRPHGSIASIAVLLLKVRVKFRLGKTLSARLGPASQYAAWERLSKALCSGKTCTLK